MITVLGLLCAVALQAQNGRDIYNRYSDEKGVSTVYISPSMFRLIGKIPDINVGHDSVNLAPLIQSLEGLYVISTEDKTVSEKIMQEASAMVRKGKFELLMEAREDGAGCRAYVIPLGDIITSFVMLAYDQSEATFICLDGMMNRAELEKVISGVIK